MKNKKKLLVVGAGLILLIVLIAVLAPWITQEDPFAKNLPARFGSPSAQHIFGLDHNGSDVFSQVVYGARISLYISIAVTFVSALLGLLIGSLSGFWGGWIDNLVMRFIDIVYAFPGILLVIALVGLFQENSATTIIFALCVTGWASYARLVRGEILHLKEKEYVSSSKALGASSVRQLVVHIWPNLAGPMIVQSTFGMAGIIVIESSLSFLGLGPPPNRIITWGGLLRAGTSYLEEAPHIAFFAGLAILILVLGFNLFGDGLRDYLDPKKTS